MHHERLKAEVAYNKEVKQNLELEKQQTKRSASVNKQMREEAKQQQKELFY